MGGSLAVAHNLLCTIGFQGTEHIGGGLTWKRGEKIRICVAASDSGKEESLQPGSS